NLQRQEDPYEFESSMSVCCLNLNWSFDEKQANNPEPDIRVKAERSEEQNSQSLVLTSTNPQPKEMYGQVCLFQVCPVLLIRRSVSISAVPDQLRGIMEAPPVTMMPVTGGTINMMEYLLQGSVLDHSLESLIHRLRGLCDNMEPETFLDHEMVFLLKGQQASPFVLRARRSMDRAGAPWHLRYLGQPEMGDKNRHALVRNCVDIATSENLTDFLMEMGFRMDHEFVAKGHLFRKGIMKIVVYKIFRILVPGNTDSTEALSLSYLVELSVVAPAGQDMVSDDMRNFAEQLKPLVHLEKIDPKRLICSIWEAEAGSVVYRKDLQQQQQGGCLDGDSPGAWNECNLETDGGFHQ
ncbi:hypothetical protein STEG23_009374, partial [Scotinomys teguina]